MELNKVIREDCICILKGKTKEEVLSELCELIDTSGKIQNISKLKESIFYREKLMSTGIGLGLAIPHVRIESVKEPIIAIGISHKGIPDYESIDDQIVKIVIMIVAGKDQHKLYIKLLSQIVAKLKSDNVIENLLSAKDASEIYSIFVEENNV
jgi:fructose-specific phosphotransferase system IIA component